MPHCIFDKASKKYLESAQWDIPQYDSNTQVHLKLVTKPVDSRLNDTEDGIRPATQAELDADIVAEEAKVVNAHADTKRASKAQSWVNYAFIKDPTLYGTRLEYWTAIKAAFRDQPWKL